MEARALFTPPRIAELIVAQRSLKITYKVAATNTEVLIWPQHQELYGGWEITFANVTNDKLQK